MEHRRIALWDLGFGPAVSATSQKDCRRLGFRHVVALCRCLVNLILGLASLILSDDVRHAVLISMSDRQRPLLYAEFLG